MEQRQLQINVNPQTLKNIACKECECKLFEQKFIIKRVPKFLAGTPVDAILHIQVWVCSNCKEILPDCLPAIKEPDPADFGPPSKPLSELRGELNK